MTTATLDPVAPTPSPFARSVRNAQVSMLIDELGVSLMHVDVTARWPLMAALVDALRAADCLDALWCALESAAGEEVSNAR